ncbi:MAG: ATP-binding protein [Candidatus Caccovivens sp.]
MKQEIIQKALNVIRQNKRNAINKYESEISHLKNTHEYEELQKQYTKTVIENGRMASEGKKANLKLETSLKEKLDLMQNHAKPKYSCSICKDEGYVNGQMCKCLKQEISKVLLHESGFEKLQNFEDGIKGSGNLKDTYLLMQKWCQSDFKKTLVYLAGPTGVGKTYLTECMANELVNRGKVVKIVTAFKLNQDFKEFSKTQNDDFLNRYFDCEVLFIDDLGTEPIYKNVTLEYLYLIINERKMRCLPTIITSNLDLRDVRNRYDERIYSRIVDRNTSITLFLDGEDKRTKKI